MVRYHEIDTCSMVNGPGCRVAIFFSGCPFHCKGCQNPETWNPKHGDIYDDEAYNEVVKALEQKYCDGLTLLGGEPLTPYNIGASLKLAKKAKELGKTVWCYTGYTYEYLLEHEKIILDYIDVLIDGRFIIEQFNPNLKWRGSANQRVIDVQLSLASSSTVLHADNNTVDKFYPDKASNPCAGMTEEEIREKYIDN